MNCEPLVSILCVAFEAGDNLQGCLENLANQTRFHECEILCFYDRGSKGMEKSILDAFLGRLGPRLRLIPVDEDPGLYELWNLGVTLARGPYITNANPDDRRHPQMIEWGVEHLESDATLDLVAFPLDVTLEHVTSWEDSERLATWFQDFAGPISVAGMFETVAEATVQSRNLPHCMPLWRKSLHQRFGCFEEHKFGPSADWEFWLRCLDGGANLLMDDRVGGLYSMREGSYGRAFGEDWDRTIIQHYGPGGRGRSGGPERNSVELAINGVQRAGVDLSRLQGSGFGLHRHGWAAAMDALQPLVMPNGIVLEPFLEKRYHFGTDEGEASSGIHAPETSAWIGFLHAPEELPDWFGPWLKPSFILNRPSLRESLPRCRGIFVLSEELRAWVMDSKLLPPDIPVSAILHPTCLEVEQFSWDAFCESPKVTQIGAWGRKQYAIHYLRAPFPKVAIFRDPRDIRQEEARQLCLPEDASISCVEYPVLSDNEYDSLLSRSVVFAWFFGIAASNIVLECIARSTPLLLNRLEASVEYLGADYPLFASDLGEASQFVRDRERLRAAHEYLSEMDKRRFSFDAFREQFIASDVWRQLMENAHRNAH
ncbi:unannotated protein [freshwater metagenome]|uniref:Unannotated protein n=1 Tax=freshwater metagenome TaxID=449393 RepID=A0A6J7KLU1_9ZZZZ